MSKDYDLKENPSFCMLGLMHTYVNPDGNVLPCCRGDTTKQALGNINEVSDWTEIWNGERYKEFRRNMMAGEKNPTCSFCYDSEKFSEFSTRKWRNMQFQEEYDEYIEKLLPSGEITTSKLKFMDFRFTNHCNQACITCGHSLSSSWYDFQSKLGMGAIHPKFIEPKDDKIAYKMIDDNLDSVSHIYFAGGEPMLSKFHWYTLDKLVESGRSKEVDLVYSTNCSTLNYHGKNVLEYWKEFKSVSIMASIDEVGERFNYIRWPGDWEKIYKNLRMIRESFDQINAERNTHLHKLCYSPVISSLNVHRFKEILVEFQEKQILQESLQYDIAFEFVFFENLLRTPKHLSILTIPDQHWSYVERILDEFEEWYCKEFIKNSPVLEKKIEFVKQSISKIKKMKELNQEDLNFYDQKNEHYNRLIQEYSKMDEVRGTDFNSTFPELGWLYK